MLSRSAIANQDRVVALQPNREYAARVKMCLKGLPVQRAWLGGSVVRVSARDRKVASLTPGRSATKQQLLAICSHPCASVTKQYNLVPTKGR